jgi:hypothetical protein
VAIGSVLAQTKLGDILLNFTDSHNLMRQSEGRITQPEQFLAEAVIVTGALTCFALGKKLLTRNPESKAFDSTITFDKIADSVRFVVENAKHVRINKTKLMEFADSGLLDTSGNGFQAKNWLESFPRRTNISRLNLSEKERLQFLLVLDSISFAYWGTPKWAIEYEGEKLDGARGLIAALTRALEEGKPILKADFLENMKREDIAGILRGNVEIPMLDERLGILNEIGRILNRDYDGEFYNMVNGVCKSEEMLNLIVEKFSSFDDRAAYKGREIYFYKRAQLLINDIQSTKGPNSIFINSNFGFTLEAFADMANMLRGGKYVEVADAGSTLLGCADYKLPYLLRKLGILEYTTELSEMIANGTSIARNSEYEVEIRASTLWAIKELKEALGGKFARPTSAMEINDELWIMAQDRNDSVPYHMTPTTAY